MAACSIVHRQTYLETTTFNCTHDTTYIIAASLSIENEMNCHDADANDHHTEEEDHTFFNRQCLELANLLRTEQTEDFLHLYDSLPAEWSGARVSRVSAVF